MNQYGSTPTTSAGAGNATNTGAGANPTGGQNPTATSSSTSPTKSATSGSDLGPFTTPELVGLVIGGIVALTIGLIIWRWLKAKVKKSLDDRDRSHSAGPSMMPAYIPTNVPIYEPAPMRSYQHAAYDPVLERRSAVSPMSPPPPMSPQPPRSPPPPVTPSPAYSAVEQHEMSEGRGIYDPIEVHGVGSTRGRVEMP